MSAINNKFDEWQSTERFSFPSPFAFPPEKFSFLDFCESKLSLMAREIMQLLVNHQLIQFTILPESISYEQNCYETLHITVTSLKTTIVLA